LTGKYSHRGEENPAKWASRYGNAWRTTTDIKDNWERSNSHSFCFHVCFWTGSGFRGQSDVRNWVSSLIFVNLFSVSHQSQMKTTFGEDMLDLAGGMVIAKISILAWVKIVIFLFLCQQL